MKYADSRILQTRGSLHSSNRISSSFNRRPVSSHFGLEAAQRRNTCRRPFDSHNYEPRSLSVEPLGTGKERNPTQRPNRVRPIRKSGDYRCGAWGIFRNPRPMRSNLHFSRRINFKTESFDIIDVIITFLITIITIASAPSRTRMPRITTTTTTTTIIITLISILIASLFPLVFQPPA